VLRLKIKEVAQSKGFTMSSLSRASDISFKTIKRLFRDPHSDLNLSTLEQIADALGVSICDLFEKDHN
jgi:transcriptional regulator with XRE-family HTH domain